MTGIIRLLEWLRYHVFWIKDFFMGAKISNHIKKIQEVLENKDPIQTKKIHENDLQGLLNHAVTTTPYYKDIKQKKSLSAFPVINKNIINSNPSQFKSSLFLKTNNKTVSTSGSTGALLTVSQNKDKVDRNTADTIYFSILAGFKVGHKLYYLRHWSTQYKKSKILSFIQNIVPIEVINMNGDKIEVLLNQLEGDPSKKGWLGYASGFESICQYLDSKKSKPIDANFKSIIAISENLNKQTKQRMEFYFRTPIVSRYSNMENGIIAQQQTDSTSHFVINWASYHVEILKLDSDETAEFGELGRIVVTDLFNFATPLIRYDTGDIGIMEATSRFPVLSGIEGRKLDCVFSTNGTLISSFIIIEACNFSGINQVQLIQETKTQYTLRLNCSEKFNHEIAVIEKFRSFLGKDAKLLIEYVNEIPILDSGKRRSVINNFLK